MSRPPDRAVTAVLGPTNTGKTHLAVERMCAHASGVIGFPLRLLAREVYDRVVKLKGANRVALITGEEKIAPADARWFCCTAESMPTGKEFAFAALDEAQLGADRERGHVFTDRLLHVRGREETMILGSETLRPMVKALVPAAEIVGRPRFSTLSYAGAKKLSRLPRRSAIVAFSAEEVYAVAEMIRRLRGGAAVVMGALSPRTRNAQVAMFQAGEVDYLVATDAIGMGLNMDVAHVAFAGLHKFDGQRRRRLTVAEMAQIAGRAGRHQKDGTFGALVEEGPEAFTPEEVLAIEGHRFPKLDHLYWREGDPDLSSIASLIATLESKPNDDVLRAAPEATDLAVLKRLAEESWVRDRTRRPAEVARLWGAAGLPDFRKLGLDPHARLVSRLYAFLSQGPIPHQWFADEIARLDTVQGDVETIAGRIAAIRTYAYIANRADWLADPAHWAERTRAIEERLSDALHQSLMQRFVDRRTTVLLRQIGAGVGRLPVVIDAEGEVSIDTHRLGRLDGFRFEVAPDARAADKRLLLAAAETQVGAALADRAVALAASVDADLQMGGDAIAWRGHPVARLIRGATLVRPAIALDPALRALAPPMRQAVSERLVARIASETARRAPGLAALDALTGDAAVGPGVRALAAALLASGGIAPRRAIEPLVAAVDPAGRQALRRAGVQFGALDLYDPRLLKPVAAEWRRTLLRIAGAPASEGPSEGKTVLPRAAPGATLEHGFRPFGAQAVRVDLVDKLARPAFEARQQRKPFALDPALATSMGLLPETLARMMAQLGFRAARPAGDGAARWSWAGVPRRAAAPPPPTDNAFAALADLAFGRG